MAAPLRGSLRNAFVIGRLFSTNFNAELRYVYSCTSCITQGKLLHPMSPTLVTSVRSIGSIFQSISSQDLWKSVTSVSNQGRKRGRGKRVGRKRLIDLNRGQVLGTGKANILWPGLNSPVIKGRQLMKQQQLPPNPDFQKNLVEMRDKTTKVSYTSRPALQRGWSGKGMPGISIGQPDPIGEYTFEGFDTRILEFKMVANMTGNHGRKMKYSAFAVTGNGKGLAGYALGKSSSGKVAIRKAKNSAAQHLRYIERYEDSTVFHSFHSKYHHTAMFVHKKQKGYGLKCHRCVKTICEVIGIKDLHVRVEGNTKNIQCVTKALFQGLENQETHQALADRSGYHVVELRKERENVPILVASPSQGQVKKEIIVDEKQDLDSDFERMYMGGRVEYVKPKKKPIYYKLKSWRFYKAREHKRRGQRQAQILRCAGLC